MDTYLAAKPGTNETITSEVPFWHQIVDGAWAEDWISDARSEFDNITPESWQPAEIKDKEGVILEKKLSIGFDRAAALPAASRFHRAMSHPRFVQKLINVTGIPNLQFDTVGGGLHRIQPGGLLFPHVDFNVDAARNRWRRVNVLLYLGECNGGELMLYGSDHRPAKAIQPCANRMVVFCTTETSWHGHPIPLGDGPDRKSIASYYFTVERPADAAPPHSTLFLRTPGDAP